MYRTLCVMALVVLCTELAHSFSWDVVVCVGNQLEFIDNNNGTVTHTIRLRWNDTIFYPTYDPVHDRVLFADDLNIYSFDIATNKTEYLTGFDQPVYSLAYDPATELLFSSVDAENIYSISLKPESRNNQSKVIEKRLILSRPHQFVTDIAVDSCGGFIYWKEDFSVWRARFNGSESAVVIAKNGLLDSLIIDQHSQKMYLTDRADYIKSADLNGKNIRTIIRSTEPIHNPTVSKDFIYGQLANYSTVLDRIRFDITQIPKKTSRSINVKPNSLSEIQLQGSMAANYNIEDITRENQNCDTLKSLLPNNSVSAYNSVSLLHVHGTKVSGESYCECAQGYSGERCDVSVCHNYCLHGDCSASAEGLPKCSCYAGYTGERCQVDVCQGYCLHGGVCSLSAESKPLCRCTEHYEGERCHVPLFQIKCYQAISLLKDILNTDVTSDKALKSSCASTAV